MTLNQPDTEFMGGGTNFFQVDGRPGGSLYRPQEVGSVVLFSGRHLHEGILWFQCACLAYSYILYNMRLDRSCGWTSLG